MVATPAELVAFMTDLATPRCPRVRVLEPACGDAPFLAAFVARYGTGHQRVGVDIDPEALNSAKERLPFATFYKGEG